MGFNKYILEGHTPKVCHDVLTWGRWMEKAKRHVAKTQVGAVNISTVFLGLDHSFNDDGPAVLFETMIFGGKHDQDEWRYHTWDEAEQGHKLAVVLVKEHG